MNTKHSHKPLLIFAISVLLVVIALYGYMFKAMTSSVAKAALARDVVAAQQNDQAQAKKLSTIVNDTVFDRARLPSFFISSDDVVSFITSLESLGSQSGAKVSLGSIDADQLTNAAVGTIGKARAHVSAVGSWSSIMRLLALTERLPYGAVVSHVRLDGALGDQKQPSWTISFDVLAPVLVAATSSTP